MNGARNKGADPGGGDRGKYSINISLSWEWYAFQIEMFKVEW